MRFYLAQSIRRSVVVEAVQEEVDLLRVQSSEFIRA